MRDYPSIPNVFRVGSSNSINRLDTNNYTENLKNDKRKLSNISGANQQFHQNNVVRKHGFGSDMNLTSGGTSVNPVERKYHQQPQQQQQQHQQQQIQEQPQQHQQQNLQTVVNTNEKSGGFVLWISTPVAAR